MAGARLAEVVGSLSLATEAAAGVAPETASRAAIVAVRLAEQLGLGPAERQDLYYTALLRYIGCTSYAHETALVGAGDDIALLRALTPIDAGSARSAARHIVRDAARGAGPVQRVRSVARLLSDPQLPRRLATAHCAQAVALANRLGAGARVAETLGQVYERYDGKGGPLGLRAGQLSPLSRVLHVAYCAVLHLSFEGPVAAVEVLRARRGGEVDPALADAFLARSGELLAEVAAPSVWERLLEVEPLPWRRLAQAEVPKVALAFAHFADLKSPYTLGHSVGVARLCQLALAQAGAPAPEQERGRLAGLLHDLGRASVPNGIWDKPGPLSLLERERVQQHSYHSERVLARAPLLADLARVVGAHHERQNGSGYHRGLPGAALDRVGRVLAAADVYQALREERAHRPARPAAEAAEVLAAEARAGRLDPDAVSAVLAAAGQRSPPLREAPPSGLSEREVEVLVLLARGLTNKEIGRRLYISPRTVGHHVEHIYEKTGARTRAAAALFAAEHELVPAGSK